jgi:hypothetical protein
VETRSEPRRFGPEPLATIVAWLRSRLDLGEAQVCIEVPDPDLGRGLFSGERLSDDQLPSPVHRPLRAWCDLADGLSCRLLTPRPVDATWVRLVFERLGSEAGWHGKARTDDAPADRYGSESDFARVRKFEDPGFLLPWMEALGRLPLSDGDRVLDLGVNRGDELETFGWMERPLALTFVGVDHSGSALAEARVRFSDPRHRFIEADLNALPEDLGRFSLVISIATLQSPGVDDHALLRRLVQQHLEPRASLLIGFPNSRHRDGELVYGARVKNLREPDLSRVVADLAFYRRYLHQHGFRTYLTGKYELLLTAVRGS